MADISTNGTPIAVLKLINPDTGEATLVYVKTCTEAVICPEGKTVQEHLAAIYGHVDNDGIHLTPAQKAAMETQAGAQEKADKAKTEAIAAASLLVQAAKKESADDATDKANASRNAAYKYTDLVGGNLDLHKSDNSNPHKVTAAQVGLGNVPNKSTNNLEPTYAEADVLAPLTSGEKLSIAFGKIAKAIADFISHLGNKENPHAVSVSQIGAAPSVHNHDDRYYTETEADGKFLSKSGGTMTGPLQLTEGVHYGDELPTPGLPGRIFFKRVSE